MDLNRQGEVAICWKPMRDDEMTTKLAATKVTGMKNTGRPGGQVKSRSAVNMRMLSKVPRAPGHLNKDQSEVYKQVCRQLIDREMLSEADLPIVESFAVSVADLREATRIVNAEGMVLVNASGNKTSHPAQTLKKQLEAQLNQSAMALGLNPRARQQLMAQGRIEDVGNSKADHDSRAF